MYQVPIAHKKCATCRMVVRPPQAHLRRRESAVRFRRRHVRHEELPRMGKPQVCVDAHVLPLGQVGETVTCDAKGGKHERNPD